VLEWSAMKMIPGLAFAVAVLPCVAQQNPSTMQKIGTVDPRFQSYNIEMVEVIGGRFWKPYGSKTVAPTPTTSGSPSGIDPGLFEQLTPVDLSNPRLRKLAAALGRTPRIFRIRMRLLRRCLRQVSAEC
jgi:heparanase